MLKIQFYETSWFYTKGQTYLMSFCADISKFIFKNQMNFADQRKCFKPKSTPLGISKMSCWKSLVRVTTFYGKFAYK